jgi:hypothetical protein
MPNNEKLVKKSWDKLNGILEYWSDGMMGVMPWTFETLESFIFLVGAAFQPR